jgi:hypothetical protein
MGAIFNTMLEFFEGEDWEFSWMEDVTALSMGFSGKNGKWMCFAQAREDQQQFIFYSVCPINVPEPKRAAIAEFITRANYGMMIGNFEMDWQDGEIRYKTSIDVEGAQLNFALLKQMVYPNVMIMDRYLPGLLAVIYSSATPAEEIAKIEGTAPAAPALEKKQDVVNEADEGFDEDRTQPTTPGNSKF